MRLSMNARGVRLDITARDDRDRILNVEMQLRNEKKHSEEVITGTYLRITAVKTENWP